MNTDKRYEFDSAQNETIGKLAKTLQFVASVVLIFSVVFGAGCVWAMIDTEWAEAVTQGMVTVFAFSMGILMLKAGGDFRAIVHTSGKDITHLMAALDDLRQMYSVLSVIIIIVILLTMVVLPFR